MKEINFLEKEQEKLKQKARQVFLVQTLALSLLVIYGLMVAAVFSNYFILNKEVQFLEEKLEGQKKRVEQEVNTETKQIYLKSKTVNFKQILLQAQNHQAVIEGFFTLIPEGVEIKNFSVSDEGVVSFAGQSKTYSALQNLLTNVKNRQFGQRRITRATVGGVALTKDGNYRFSLTLHLQPMKITDKKT